MIELRPASSLGRTEFHGTHMVHHFCFGPYQSANRLNWGQLRMLNHISLSGKGARDPYFLGNMDVLLLVESGEIMVQCDTSRIDLYAGDFGRFAMNYGGDFGVAHRGSLPASLIEIWFATGHWDGLPQASRGRWVHPAKHAPQAHEEESLLQFRDGAGVRLVDLEQGASLTHDLATSHGYLCLLAGELQLGDALLQPNDAVAIREERQLSLLANARSRYLLIAC